VVGRDSDLLRAEWTVDRIPVGSRFSVPVLTYPGSHPACCTVGTVLFPKVKSTGWSF